MIMPHRSQTPPFRAPGERIEKTKAYEADHKQGDPGEFHNRQAIDFAGQRDSIGKKIQRRAPRHVRRLDPKEKAERAGAVLPRKLLRRGHDETETVCPREG
jgi:hypothetical protein